MLSTSGPLMLTNVYIAYRQMPEEIPRPLANKFILIFYNSFNHFQALIPQPNENISNILFYSSNS